MSPMPESLGFTQPRTIGEMLPDQPLTMPDGTRGRYKYISQANLYPHICAACGKKFDAASEYRYRVSVKSQSDKYYCSYNCFKPVEDEMLEKFKRDTLGNCYALGTEDCNLTQARQRVKKCESRLAELQAQREDPAIWGALPSVNRKSLTKLISRWKQKLDDARAFLKEVEASEAECT